MCWPTRRAGAPKHERGKGKTYKHIPKVIEYSKDEYIDLINSLAFEIRESYLISGNIGFTKGFEIKWSEYWSNLPISTKVPTLGDLANFGSVTTPLGDTFKLTILKKNIEVMINDKITGYCK